MWKTGKTGKDTANLLEKIGITANKNTVPNDPLSPFVTSGVRIGTPAVTTRGFKEDDMKEVASIIDFVLRGTKPGIAKDGKPAKGKIELDPKVQKEARERVNKLLNSHVLYPELDLDFLKKEFVK